LRLSIVATRWAFCAVALVVVAAFARNAASASRERVIAPAAPTAPDPAADWFALSFARAYLSWSTDPGTHQSGLSEFLSSADDPDAGLTPAPGAAEKLTWVEIAAEHPGTGGLRDYTIAAATTGGAIRYLAVTVARNADGREVLAHYPALVGAPSAARAGSLDGSGLPNVTDPQLVTVLTRAIRNYIDRSGENLAADLATGAQVAPVAPGLTMRALSRLAVEPSGSVLATVVASDQGGDLFTLGYELTPVRLTGRWEIARIQS
jgi:hypothetical protein